MAIPKDPVEFRRYIMEMLAEMIEHYGVPIPISKIEDHVRIELEPAPGGKFVTHYRARTGAGEALLERMNEEERYIDEELAAGRDPVQRDWTRKWQ
jgi:hypothetical protein